MRITIAAPTRHDLPDGRISDYYGDHPQDWNPYHPAAARPLAYVAEELVRSLNYQAQITSFDEESGRPRGSRRPPPPRSSSSTAGPSRTRTAAAGSPPSTRRTGPG